MVADDYDDTRELVVLTLSDAGFRTVHVSDGREAVASARLLHPDVILLDLRMPHLSGHQAIALLQRDPETRGIPIVVISGADADELARAVAMGASASHSKPCIGATMIELVRAAIDRQE
ncbi:MAG: response regulator [Myxococcota bacterium]|nr:response regulator [Myxococcota bacterium]